MESEHDLFRAITGQKLRAEPEAMCFTPSSRTAVHEDHLCVAVGVAGHARSSSAGCRGLAEDALTGQDSSSISVSVTP